MVNIFFHKYPFAKKRTCKNLIDNAWNAKCRGSFDNSRQGSVVSEIFDDRTDRRNLFLPEVQKKKKRKIQNRFETDLAVEEKLEVSAA